MRAGGEIICKHLTPAEGPTAFGLGQGGLLAGRPTAFGFSLVNLAAILGPRIRTLSTQIFTRSPAPPAWVVIQSGGGLAIYPLNLVAIATSSYLC